MAKDASISLRLDSKILKKIDQMRGDVSRSVFIRKTVEEVLK